MIITTRDRIEEKKVVKELGMVYGNTVKSRHFISDFIASIRDFLGLEIKEYTQMLKEAREECIERMVEEAESLEANAVLNVRFMTSEMSKGGAELLVYGTAVVVE